MPFDACQQLTIEKCRIEDMENSINFSEMLIEYANELAIEGLPHPKAKIEMYKQLEALGSLHPIAAYFDSKIIGLINVLMPMNPHYGVPIAVSESFFVCKEYRKTGAGSKLRRAAEECARSLGSPGIFISSPSKGVLSEILPHNGYVETGKVFFKCLN